MDQGEKISLSTKTCYFKRIQAVYKPKPNKKNDVTLL